MFRMFKLASPLEFVSLIPPATTNLDPPVVLVDISAVGCSSNTRVSGSSIALGDSDIDWHGGSKGRRGESEDNDGLEHCEMLRGLWDL
jgi:hypothetical protein